ncbi:relaxase/mobilization nuclease domain-containing protein [Campylobacter estrildidarum]|uniref:Relaxase n=1 Tax=Campylobacter estrildidarum TaxID=2510189 RepID=A0A4U7BMR4_9BACT|nr:relaxase/mobilization nuclease domain-containing protein [Campylobacter estrildidarum]TKX31505.1 relaxase [Campylobacter estrildidarum]
MQKKIEELLEEIKKVKKASSIIKDNFKRNKIFNHYVSSYSIKNNINNFNKSSFSKQVIVKLLSNLSSAGAKRAMEYILKNNDNSLLINEKGEEVTTKEVLKDWKKDFSKSENAKDAWHLMFSIKENPTPKNLEILKKSVQQVMDNNFLGYKYVMVLHTHQNNPHVHIVLNKRNILTKKKIHFDKKEDVKEFWDDIRNNFCMTLNNKGLRYHNHSILEKDLKKECQKIKRNLYLDEYETKNNLNEILLNNIQRENIKIEKKKSRIDFFSEENKNLKDERNHLLNLFNQYKKKNNKKFYKIGRDLKLNSKKIKENENSILNEMKELKEINSKIEILNKELNKLTYEKIIDAKRLEMFSDSIKNVKISSKKDYQEFLKVKNTISKNNQNLDDAMKKNLEANLISLSLFNGKKQNIFNLEKKIQSLDNAIYLLKKSNSEVWEYENYLKNLESNKDFLQDNITLGFKNLKLELSNKNIKKINPFLIKEYEKGCEILNIKDDLNIINKSKISYSSFSRKINNKQNENLKDKGL